MKTLIEEYKDRMRQDQTPTPELISRALEASAYSDDADDELSDRYWNPIRVMHCRADDEVMSSAAKLIASADAVSRSLGANILAQVAIGDETKGPNAGNLLVAALQREQDPVVLKALLYALGHTPDLKACPRLSALLSHPAPDVRVALAYALPKHAEDTSAIPSLIALSRDPDADVRDWATFGIGSQIEADTPEIRNALVARVDDSNRDVVGEAIAGLALRRDARVIPPLLEELKRSPGEAKSSLVIDATEECLRAAENTANPVWLPLLEKLKEYRLIDTARVDQAIHRCSKTAV